MKKLLLLFLFAHVLLGYWWSTPQNLGITGADDINPQACRVQLIFYPRTCLVWQTDLNGNWDIFSRFSYGGTWGDTLRVTTDVSTDSYSSVAYDFSRNCFWCAWQNNSTGYWDIFVAQTDTSGGWLSPYQLTTSDADDESPSVYVYSDTVWLVWQRSVTDSTNIYSTYYDGTTWATPSPITSDSGVSNIHPKINGRHDHPFVAWQRNDDIYYSDYLGGAWQSPQPITTDPGNDHNPEVASNTEPAGPPFTYGVWVVWQSDRDGNYEIYTTAYDTLNVHYRLTFDDSADIAPSPLHFLALLEQSSPSVTAFSTNRNGDYDIYTLFNYWYGDTLVPVDTADSEDILPVMTGGDVYVWVLWQTDRNGDWDIYGSNIFVGGVEESNACDFKAAANLTIDPNPFREMTTIKFQVPSTKSQTSLKIYDVSGKLVRSFNLASPASLREAGRADFLSLASTFSWDGTDNSGFRLPPGVYFVQLENESEALTEKVVLIK